MLEHADWLRGLARQLVRDGAEAEDVLQETLMAAGNLPAPEGVAERSWLAGIARNLIRNRRTRESRLKRRERDVSRGESTATSALDDAALIERQRDLLANVESLPEDQRRVILLRFYDGLPPRRIASDEGIPVAAVHRRIELGLKALRKELDSAYGDRRTWAAWAAPLGGVAPKAQGVAAVGAIAVAAVAVVAAAVGAWSLLTTPDEAELEPTLNASEIVGLAGVNQAQTDATSVGAELVEVSESSAPDQDRVAAAGVRGYSVQVLSGGLPAAGATVIAVSSKAFENDQRALFRKEQTIWNQGVHQTADDEGHCTFEFDPPFLVQASDELGLAHYSFDGSSSSATMELERAARLTVQVVDQNGQALGEAEREGLKVTAFTTLKDVFDKGTPGNNDLMDQPAHDLVDGVACFQNPWFGLGFGGVVAGTDNWNKSSIEAVALWIPGAAEFAPESMSADRFRPFKRRVGEQVRTLTMPPIGALRIEVLGPEGEVDPVNGSVQLSFKKAPLRGHLKPTYGANLTDGIAEFRAFVTGSREFEVAVELPAEGSSWTFKGTGPGRKGEVRTVKTLRPERSVVKARLVDSLGKPLARKNVTLNYALVGYGNDKVDRHVRATSSADGSIRFEVPPEEDVTAPFAIVVSAGLFSGAEEAIKLIDVEPAQIRNSVDLGEVEMEWQKSVSLKGQVVGEDGVPLAGVRMTLDRPGRNTYGADTDERGLFQFNLTLDPESVLTADASGLGYLPKTVPIDSIDPSKPLEVNVRRGAPRVANNDFSAVPELHEWSQILLQDADGESVYVHRREDGRFQSLPLENGPYRASLRMPFGAVPIAVIEGIEVPPDGSDFSDSRIDGIRLTDLIREVELTHNGAPFARPPGVQVRAVGVTIELGGKKYDSVFRRNSSERRPVPCILPLHIPTTLLIEGSDGTSALFEDAQALGDTVDVTFGSKLSVRLNLLGTASEDLSYELRGETGTRTSGATARFSTRRLTESTRSVKVEFPMPGTYRLYQSERPTPASTPGGVVAMEVPQPTTATIEVVDESPLSIRIDAPRR